MIAATGKRETGMTGNGMNGKERVGATSITLQGITGINAVMTTVEIIAASTTGKRRINPGILIS